MSVYRIRDNETDEIVHEIATIKTGRDLLRFEEGLYRRVDLDRFYIEYPPDEEEP